MKLFVAIGICLFFSDGLYVDSVYNTKGIARNFRIFVWDVHRCEINAKEKKVFVLSSNRLEKWLNLITKRG